MKHLNNIKNNWPQALKIALFACLSIAFIASSLDWRSARKIYYVCSVIGFIAFVFTKPKKITNKSDYLIPLSLCLFGTGVLVWALISGLSDGTGNYYSYKSLAKITISAAALMLFFQSGDRLILNKPANYFFTTLFCLLIIVLAAFSYYQSFYLHLNRASVGSNIATMAAYMVSIAGLTSISFILGDSLSGRKLFLISIIFILTYISIILTETRSTILAFPLVFLACAFLFKNVKQIPHKKKFIGFIVIMIGLVSYEFGPTLHTRMNAVLVDIDDYTLHNDSTTSLGARFAMYKTGLSAGVHSPLGQTIEQRAHFIKSQISTDPKDDGALKYVYTNLHNEIVENFSLRGVWGVGLLFFVYFSILYTAIIKRNAFLFAIGLSVIVYGLTDVIFSDDLPLTYYIAMIFSLCISTALPNKIASRNDNR